MAGHAERRAARSAGNIWLARESAFTGDAWAKDGRDHMEIVTASYPGTSVVRAY